jgi:hypothetical protein
MLHNKRIESTHLNQVLGMLAGKLPCLKTGDCESTVIDGIVPSRIISFCRVSRPR